MERCAINQSSGGILLHLTSCGCRSADGQGCFPIGRTGLSRRWLRGGIAPGCFRVGPHGGMNNPGSDLLSHAVTRPVPSAVESLTSVFGMGTGVTPLL